MEKKTEQEKGAYRIYGVEIEDQDDLRCLEEHLPQFLDTADRNDKKMVIEIWLENTS
jgi:hypothetical protein